LDKERERERETDRQRERDRQTDRQTERERDIGPFYMFFIQFFVTPVTKTLEHKKILFFLPKDCDCLDKILLCGGTHAAWAR